MTINGIIHTLSNAPLHIKSNGDTSDTASGENLLSVTSTLCQRLASNETPEILLGELSMGNSHILNHGDNISIPKLEVDLTFYGFLESNDP